MTQGTTYVALDDSKRKVVVAILRPEQSQAEQREMRKDPQLIRRLFQPITASFRTSTHTGASEKFISTSRLLAASAASERYGKPKTRSGIMKKRRDTLMRERLSATIVARQTSGPEAVMTTPPRKSLGANAGGLPRLGIRTRWVARIAQFSRWALCINS